jgi:hypothetical protein
VEGRGLAKWGEVEGNGERSRREGKGGRENSEALADIPNNALYGT